MTEPTDPAAPPEVDGQANPLPAAAGAGRSPMQQAHTAYSRHATTCPRCSDVDHSRCPDGQRLWRDWEDACEEAYRLLTERTA